MILKEVVLTSNCDLPRAGFDVAYTHIKKCLLLSHRNVGKQLLDATTERRFLEGTFLCRPCCRRAC